MSKLLRPIRSLLMIGFGSIGQASLPMLLKNLPLLNSTRVVVIDPCWYTAPSSVFKGCAYSAFVDSHVVPQNYEDLLSYYDDLHEFDLVVNVSVEVSSVDIMKWCLANDTMYIDACVEPWRGGYRPQGRGHRSISNAELRDQALALNTVPNSPTCMTVS